MKKLMILMSLLLSLSGVSSVSEAATELKLDLNLPAQSGEYHNPYVAVWIENERGQSVRTLVLWREGAKWLKDIRRWWRKVGRKDEAIVDAMTSATRPAGNYQLKFKALDDQLQPLKYGNYVLRIEIVRENGGRSMTMQPFTLNGENHQFTVAKSLEIAQSLFTIKE